MTDAKAALLGFKQTFATQAEASSQIRHLLIQAGTAKLYRETGENPSSLRLPVLPQPEDSRERCSQEAAEVVGLILSGFQADLLGEVLELLSLHRLRVPETLLPPLLDKASKTYALRPSVLQVIGETGHWLAAQHPDWRFAESELLNWQRLSQDWCASSATTRQGIFYQARLQDPGMSLAILETTWKSELPAALSWIIAMLSHNLGMHDESFLERALDDRNLMVRRKASELLAALPDSRLALRMQEQAERLIDFDGEDFRFYLAELSPEILRDGVLLRTIKDETKLQQAYLADIVAAVPLSYWQECYQLDPETLLELASKGDCKEGLMKGWATAAERQGNAVWAKALLGYDELSLMTMKLIPLLDETAFLELCQAFAVDHEASDQAFGKAFNRWLKPYSLAVLELYLEELVRMSESCRNEAKYLFVVRSSFRQCARFAPVSQLAELERVFGALAKQEALAASLNECLSTITFRQRMHQAF